MLLYKRINKINMSESNTQGNGFESYDFLFDQTPEVVPAPPDRQPTDRERLLFQPLEAPSTAEDKPSDYSRLFSGEELTGLSVEGARVRAKEERPITETMEKDALSALERASARDDSIAAIIDGYRKERSLALKDIPSALRSDQELRFKFGTHLADKMDTEASSMPRRIRVNSEKSPDVKGYEKFRFLTSREYSVLLALSMLDGSFSNQEEASRSDPVHYDPSTDEGGGQHRFAARKLLFG